MDTLTVQVWKLDFREFKSPAAKLVALALARFGHYTGQVLVKQSGIADICGVSKQTVARCLDELEQAGWIERKPRRRGDGSRSSDVIWLTLPAVTLESTSVDLKEAARLERAGFDDGATVDSQDTTLVADKAPGSVSQGATESPPIESDDYKKGNVLPAREAADPDVDIGLAVNMIWARASKVGRQRSSKADIETGLKAALGRGHDIKRIMLGLGGYFASPDAQKDDGAYQRGAHVMLAKDRFLSFVDDAESRAAAGEVVSPAAQAAMDDLGTLEQPSEKRQRVWMDLYSKGMAWDLERGPPPGRQGCRISDAIQREFGQEPWAPLAPVDSSGDDAAAFD